MMMKKYWMLVVAVLMLSASSAFALNVGDPAPTISGVTVDGQKVDLAQMKDQVVVLKLATTWCPTCKEQSQELAKAGEFLKDSNVPVVEVFFQESAGTVNDYMKEHQTEADVYALTDDGDIFGAYNVYLIPRIVVIDKKGNVARDGGVMKADNMKILIEQLLKR